MTQLDCPAVETMPLVPSQEALDANLPKLERGPLVEELRSRGAFMPQIHIDMEWVERGFCAGVDNSTFFPKDSMGVRIAKQYCIRCNVRNECLEYALLNRIEHGVWGGASERQRIKIQKERRDARLQLFAEAESAASGF